jgi:uncharacterized protein
MDLQSDLNSLQPWEDKFQKEIESITVDFDPSHDLLHLKRVVKMAKSLCLQEKANPNIVVPAAWLHDFVVIPKDSPLRKQASQISARRGVEFLESINYPSEYHAAIAHGIEAHSFSANITPQTLEACIVQDADRLDALGAVGLARVFITAGRMKRPLYQAIDPFCQHRLPDDSDSTIDHFYTKLFKIAETLRTDSAKAEGQRRLEVMRRYLDDLAPEIN